MEPKFAMNLSQTKNFASNGSDHNDSMTNLDVQQELEIEIVQEPFGDNDNYFLVADRTESWDVTYDCIRNVDQEEILDDDDNMTDDSISYADSEEKQNDIDVTFYEDQAENTNRGNDSDDSSFSSKLKKIGKIAALKRMVNEKVDTDFTKAGHVRKRRPFKLSLKERELKKQELKHVCHPIRDPCKHEPCNVISKTRRLEINREFWDMSPPERYTFGFSSISRKEISRRRNTSNLVRNNTFTYNLKNGNGNIVPVCKIFYLTTLGFAKNNDAFIKTIMGKDNYKKPLPRRSQQGKHSKTPKKDRETIISHIKSFQPVISHHRRLHAPRRLYLPSEITIRLLYNHFKDKHPEFNCSYELYRGVVTDDMHISFAKLGNEECEICEEHDNHMECKPDCKGCKTCVKYRKHITKAGEARNFYGSQKDCNTEEKGFYSLDMQKVTMLPRLEMFKKAIFCPRIIAFNESFVPLGERKVNGLNIIPIPIIWHEGISGRKKEDVISAIHKFLLSQRDLQEIDLWMDNCASQNKNWTLLTFLTYIVNSDSISAKKINFNYFEPGHTFMSADNFHYQVELSMKQMSKIYDFNDYRECVKKANSGHVEAIEMKLDDFRQWKDYSSKTKLKKAKPRPYLSNMVQITATRGSHDLTYKKSFTSNEEFPLNFLQKKIKKQGVQLPEPKFTLRGITKKRKMKIIKKLFPIIPDNRKGFWQNIAEAKEETTIGDSEDDEDHDYEPEKPPCENEEPLYEGKSERINCDMQDDECCDIGEANDCDIREDNCDIGDYNDCDFEEYNDCDIGEENVCDIGEDNGCDTDKSDDYFMDGIGYYDAGDE